MDISKNSRRAVRRHHKARMRARITRQERDRTSSLRDTPNPEITFVIWHDLKGNRRHFHTWEDVFEFRHLCSVYRGEARKKCSCWMCGNARRHHQSATVNEHRAFLRDADEVEAYGLRPLRSRFRFGW